MEGFGRGARRHLEVKAPRKGSAARIQTHHLLPSGIMEGRAASWGRSFGLKMEKLKMEKFWRWMVHRE